MLIKSVTLKNFRGYEKETKIEFSNLTTFVGRNDIGKSTILEALDIFFNEGKGCVSIDEGDVNKKAFSSGDEEIIIAVEFVQLPINLILDDTNTTSLEKEYLLTNDKTLMIVKKYKNGGKEKVYIRANHPSNEECCELLSKKINELKAIVKKYKIENCEDFTKKAEIRTSIWNYFNSDLELGLRDIDVTKEEGKTIWNKLKQFLPIYTLFQADRTNDDHDKEVQDPLKEAVKLIFKDKDVLTLCESISEKVKDKLKEVSDNTLGKIREMNSDLANSLNPNIPSFADLKWADLFKKVSIAGDDDIPINKRGSGVKRLILLNFFRAEAERIQKSIVSEGIIYAIEEPETSQHFNHQKILMDALKKLSESEKVQVVLTTHSSYVVKRLDLKDIRLIMDEKGEKKVHGVENKQLSYLSLNEINYTSFGEITEEYHNELYGYICFQKWLNDYKIGKKTYNYIKENLNGENRREEKILSEKIRHQIHHPENKLNDRFTEEELKESIEIMRKFIEEKNKKGS